MKCHSNRAEKEMHKQKRVCQPLAALYLFNGSRRGAAQLLLTADASPVQKGVVFFTQGSFFECVRSHFTHGWALRSLLCRITVII
jgi:hypothetical protein